MHLRPIRLEDLPAVSDLGIHSKAHWGYSAEQMQVFTEELTHGAELLERSLEARVLIDEGKIVGYYTLAEQDDESIELDFMFVDHRELRRGLGTAMMQEAIHLTKAHGANSLMLIADPHAVGFYESFGATQIGQHQSSIPGRSIPVMKISLR